MTLSPFMRGIASVALLLLLCLTGAVPLVAEPMNFIYTYHQFAYNDTLTLLEFNIQFSDRGLTYRRDESGAMTGKLFTRFILTDSLDRSSLIGWTMAVSQPAPGAEPQTMLGSRMAAMPPGRYRAQVYYEDMADTKRRDSASFTLDVRPIPGRGLQLSDIEIVAEATQSDDTANLFYKNGYLVIPNVATAIEPPFLVLNTYLEIYNTDRIGSEEYTIRYMLANKRREVFFEREVRRPKSKSPVVVSLNAFPLDSVPNGEYYIVAKVFPTGPGATADTAIVFRSFILSNPDLTLALAMGKVGTAQPVATATGGVIDPIYAGMQEKELDDEYAKMKYIAKDIEKEIWAGLEGVEAKARFLSNFWAIRDLTPETSVNEARDNYYELVEQARVLYTSAMAPRGWDSDRGRILLQYGKPDGIDRHAQDFNMRPYEVWRYSNLSYEFVFVDRSQTGLYRLVHSSAPRETRHENWLEEYAMLNKKWENK